MNSIMKGSARREKFQTEVYKCSSSSALGNIITIIIVFIILYLIYYFITHRSK